MGNELLKVASSGNTEEIKVSDSFYSCLDCNACLHVCPAGVNAGLVSHISRKIITSGGISKNENPLARMIVNVTMKYMNPLGVREKCAEWFNGMRSDPHSPDLLYTGNMFQLMAYTKTMSEFRKRMGSSASTFMSRMVSRAPALIKLASRMQDTNISSKMNGSLANIARLLGRAGISFKYLEKDEPYPGTFIYDLGYEDLFRQYAEKVTEIFRKAGARRIITVDPHTYDLLKTAYPKYVDHFDFEIVHYLDLIGNLKYRDGGERITYHEPCHFSLRDDVYNAPLLALRKISKVELPPRSGRRTMCCGGPDELLFPDIAEKVSEDRYRELDGMHSDRIVTACPICYSNLSKGDQVVEIGDYLAEVLLGAEA